VLSPSCCAMTRIPSLTSLKTFETAARLSSFKKAATELNLSTSAISHQIRGLEENLDVILFLRHPGGVTLSDAGQLYLGYVRRSLEQLEEGASVLKRMQRQDTIRISLLSSFSTLWLIPNLMQFNQMHPNTRVELDDDVGIVDFSIASFDAAIRYDFSGTGHWNNVTTHPLFEEWIVPVCSPGYLQEHPEIAQLGLNNRHTLLINKRHPEEWQHWLQAQDNLSVHPSYELQAHNATTMLDTSNMTLMAASKGMGIALGRTPFIFVASAITLFIHQIRQALTDFQLSAIGLFSKQAIETKNTETDIELLARP